jgi:hypothetical protein
MLKPKVIPQVLQQAQTNGVKAVRYELNKKHLNNQKFLKSSYFISYFQRQNRLT